MKTKKQLEAENSILWISVIVLFVIGVTATIGCIYKSKPQEECLDKYWEQEYNTIKNLYHYDEALLKYWTKIDSWTWSLPLEYAPDF